MKKYKLEEVFSLITAQILTLEKKLDISMALSKLLEMADYLDIGSFILYYKKEITDKNLTLTEL